MDGRQAKARSGWWEETKPILLLVLLAVGFRAWQLTHTEVTSRDSIGYIRFAWRLEHESWPEVLRSSHQHPGYPLTILAVSGPIRALVPNDLALSMQLSAQVATSLASVLLVVPMFLLGRELFDRRVCFVAVLLFQCLPSSGRLMGDGLSEPLFLLFASSSLLGAAHGLRTSRPAWFAVAGVAGALAYLTRPEGALVVASAGTLLVFLWLAGRWTAGRRSFFACGQALAVASLLVAVPYVWTIGRLTSKPSANQMLEAPRNAGLDLGTSLPLAAWKPDWQEGGPTDWSWAASRFVPELARAFFYVFWLPALIGLVWFRETLRQPAAWLLLLTVALLTVALFRLAGVMGYISDRHAVLILLIGVYWVAATLLAFGSYGMSLWRTARPEALAMAVVLLCCAVPLAKTLEGLHSDRQGFREAGYWLAANTGPTDEIIDPYCWAGYYAGCVFREQKPGRCAVGYVVIEEAGKRHSHLKAVEEAIDLAHSKGREVKSWQVPGGRVVVYRVPGKKLPTPSQEDEEGVGE